MMLRWRSFRGGSGVNLVVAVTLLLMGSCFFAAQRADASERSGYDLVNLKNISSEQGKEYLAELVTATVTLFPGNTMLCISGESGEVAKAGIILDLVDSPEQYVIQTILPLTAARNMPSNDQIASKLHPSLTKGVSIGNFSNPPRKDATTRAIIDIHNDAVVAIAPAKLMERIIAAVGPSPSQEVVKAQDKPIPQEESEIPAKLKVSGLVEPTAAKFLLAANAAAKAPPKKSPAKTAPDVSPAKTSPSTSPPAKIQPSSTAARLQMSAPAAKPEKEAPVPGTTAGSVVPTSAPDGDEVVNLALADTDKLTIEQFLGLVGPYLQLDFMYDSKMLTGDFTINPNGKWRGPIKVRDLYPMLEDVLKFRNLVMTRSKGNLVTIVPVGEALTIDPALLNAYEGEIERGDGVVTRVFDLEHVDTTSATNLLTSMRLTIAPPIPKGKAIIVTGYAHRMPRIQALLDIIDEPGDKKEFRFRQLRYTTAETLAPKLQALAEQLGTMSITVGQTSSSTSRSTAPSKPKGSNESTTQYQARLRAEAATRARALAARRTAIATPAPAPAPEKPTVFLDADERTNRVLMIGLDEQLDEVEELIDTLDVVQQDLRALELYKIEHVEAEEVKNKLEELGIITPRMTSPYSSRITSGAKPGTTTAGTTRAGTTSRLPTSSRNQMYGETDKAPGEEPQVVVVEQTNSLLVNATAEQHEKIVRILAYVDREMLDSDIPVQLYPLENQSPAHLAEVLDQLIQETTQDKEGKIQTVMRNQDEEIIIVPEPNTFSLIVYANKKNQEWISNIIQSLDKRRPQVLIDVTLVQITKVDTFEYDLNLLSSFPDLTETAGLVGALEPTNLVPALLSANRDRFIDFQSQGGVGRAFYGDKHINALLTAVQTKSYGRVLAKPKILVNDNELGMIEQIKTTYIERTGSTLLEGNSVGVQTSQEFEGYEEGIKLEITPHISSGNLLRLDVLLTRSDFAEGGPSDKPPDIENNDIDTTVTVPDGSTIILGGLTKLDQNKAGSKIPLLGDLPLVGGLFRSANNTDRGDNMYVFIKAEIIRPAGSELAQSDLERISERNRTAFEEHETEFQQNRDWPGVKPKPMKPLKVLDAQ